jgi:hypothetical protein
VDQGVYDVAKDDPVGDPAAVAPPWMRRIELGPVGKQRAELVPQRFEQG